MYKKVTLMLNFTPFLLSLMYASYYHTVLHRQNNSDLEIHYIMTMK